MTTILGIDPGSKCGWCVILSSGHVLSGTWNLQGGRHEGGGMRYVRLRKYLNELRAMQAIDRVYYEEVRRHAGTDAAHIYGGIIATLSEWCEESNTPYAGIPVATIKKYATGKGNADKAAMIAAAVALGHNPGDDNEADAIHIARFAGGTT